MATDATMPRAAAPARLPVFAFLGGNAISLIGSMLTWVALPWFVLETTGSAGKMGITAFVIGLPGFLMGVFGGALVDRVGYRRVSIAADLVSGVSIVLIPILHHTVGLAFWELLVLVFFAELLAIPGLTARRSMIPELAGLARSRLEPVNAAFEGTQFAALLVAPPVAGLLIAFMGADNVLMIDSLTFVVSALAVALAVPARLFPPRPSVTTRYAEDLKAGLRFLRNDDVLLTLAAGLAISNLVNSPLTSVVLPVFVKQTWNDATRLGLLAGAFGLGALIGAALYGTLGYRFPRRPVWIAGYMFSTIVVWVLLFSANLSIIMAGAVVGAMAAGPLNPLLVTVRHERIPQELRGRVFSTFSAISQVAAPMGMLAAGFAIERFGLRGTIAGIAVASQFLAIGMLFLPTLNRLDESRLHEDAVAR
jgi:MFS family permease